MVDSIESRGRFWFAVITAAATLVLIVVGGLVTSHGVGMSVPDWPNTYGYNMFFFPFSKWAGGIFYEHSHRLVASAVGLLTVILALWLHGRNARSVLRVGSLVLVVAGTVVLAAYGDRWSDAVVLISTGVAGAAASLAWPWGAPAAKWLRRLGLIAVGAVVLQGVLGGLRVTQIKDELGIFHAALAQLFFVLICAITLFDSPWWRRLQAASRSETATGREPAAGFAGIKPTVAAPLRTLYVWATVLIFAQLVLGATMRHQHAGLAIPDFPLAYGKLWPATDPASIEVYNQRRLEVLSVKPITAAQIHLQMAHRGLAALIVLAVGLAAAQTLRRLGRKNLLSFLNLAWVGLILTQVLLGAVTIWSGKAADIATAHVLVGAVSLALGSLICIVSIRVTVSINKIKPVLCDHTQAPGQSLGTQPSAAN